MARRGLLGSRALALGDAHASGHRLPLSRALDELLVCCLQAGLPTFPTGGVPRLGTRGKKVWWIQVGGKIRGVREYIVTETRAPASSSQTPTNLPAAKRGLDGG